MHDIRISELLTEDAEEVICRKKGDILVTTPNKVMLFTSGKIVLSRMLEIDVI